MNQLSPLLRYFGLPLIFGLTFPQSYMYTAPQAGHFIRGLAWGGHGLLSRDWVINTPSPLPAISVLIMTTYRYLDEFLFYVYFTFLAGVYIYSLLGIVTSLEGTKNSKPKILVLFLVLALMHSPLFAPHISNYTPSFVDQFVFAFRTGFAKHFIFNGMFLPSNFGALVFLSIFLCLKRRYLAGAITGCFGAAIHPAYLMSMWFLVLTYMWFQAREERDTKGAILTGAISLALVLPSVLYSRTIFQPTSPEIFEQSLDILLERFPHQAIPLYFFGINDAMQIVIIGVGLFLARGTRLFPLLMVLSVATAALSGIQIITGNKILALTIPWRISVFIVPISTALIAARLVNCLFEWCRIGKSELKRSIRIKIVCLMIALPAYGVIATYRSHADSLRTASIPVMNFVKQSRASGDLYLIPLKMIRFRLYAGVPILVDWNVPPFGDSNIVEWRRRYDAAKKFHESPDNGFSCGLLRKMVGKYKITHVIVSRKKNLVCEFARNLYQDDDYSSFQIRQ